MTTDEINGGGIRAEERVITPEMAHRILEHRNPRNRPVRESRVLKYMVEMLEGQWELNGEAIKFDKNGNLLDGQHRLAASVKGDVAFRTLVITGLDSSSQVTMDTGSARTPGDMLGLSGIASSTIVAAGVKGVIVWDRYRWQGVDAKKFLVTHPEILRFVQQNPQILELPAAAQTVSRKVDLTPSEALATWFILDRIDPSDTESFFSKLASGVGLDEGSPILALRERLRIIRTNKTKVPTYARYSLVFRAWNASREGRSLATLPVTTKSVVPA